MSMRARIIVATTLVWLSGCTGTSAVAAQAGDDPAAGANPGAAATAQLRLPDLDSLRRKATQSVNVTLGRLPLSLASWGLGQSNDPKDQDLREVLQHIDLITVRAFKFDADYDHSVVESVRRQLSAPGWSRLIEAHQDGDNVDIYVLNTHQTLNGLTILASKPRELTIINITGSVDPAKLATLVHHFGGAELPM